MNDFSIKRTTNIARLLWPTYKADMIKNITYFCDSIFVYGYKQLYTWT